MKKTFTINISGTVFHIDEDAHEKLSSYLNKITRHFGNDADAKEIEQDIESRISELFSQKLKSGNEVITIDHVEEIIQIMGMPEDFSDTKEEKADTGPKIYYSRARKLYRDPDDRILGGVCSGLGAYFNIDRTIVRLIFIALLILGAGSSLLIYIILWIVVPKARSIAQKLEMKGEQVNVSSISKSIKEEIHDVKENYQKYRDSRSSGQGNGMSPVLKALLILAFIILSPVLLILLVVVIILLFVSLIVSGHFIGLPFKIFGHGFSHFPWSQDFTNYLNLYINNDLLSWAWIGLLLVICVPLIMLIYAGIKFIFRLNYKNKAIGFTALGLWLIGLLILIGTGVSGIKDFRTDSIYNKQEIIPNRTDTLYLKLGQDEFSDYLNSESGIGKLGVASLNGKQILIGSPRFSVEKSESNDFILITKARARGKNVEKAQLNAKEILYKYEMKDSSIYLNPRFMIPSQSSWHSQELDIILKVPVNKTIYLNDDMVKIIHDIKNTSDTWDGDMGGKYWTMKPQGLELAQRKLSTISKIKK